MNIRSSIIQFILSKYGVITVKKTGVSSLPITISNSKILASHKVTGWVLSNPSAQTGGWTVTTSTGSLTISGSISGTTDIELNLEVETDTITG